MPASPDQIGSLRKSLGNLGALRTLSESDPELKSKSEYMSGRVQKPMNDFEQEDLANFILDWHYKGKIPHQETTIGYQQGLSHINAPITRGPEEDDDYEGFSILKTIKNIPRSGARLIGDVAMGAINVFNPDMEKNTLLNLGKIVLGTAGNSIETVAGALGIENPEDLLNLPGEEIASAVGKFYADRYGGTQNILQTIQEDPVGFLGDVAILFTGGGAALKGVSKVAQVGAKAVTMTGMAAKTGRAGGALMRAGTRIDPTLGVARAAKAGVTGTAKIGQFGVSQATGFSPDTIRSILKNPQFKLAEGNKITRVSLGEKVKKAIGKMKQETSATGKEYAPVLRGQKTTLTEGWLDNFLQNEENGFLIKKGNVTITDDTKIRLTSSELSKLNSFYKEFRKKNTLTGQQFINLRHEIADKLAEFEGNVKSRSLESLSNKMYDEFNKAGRSSIKGLEALDERFSPQIKEFRSYEKEFIDPVTGEIKSDRMFSQIAAANEKTKPLFMKRLEEKVPEIRDEINALRAMEDIIGAGEKPGRYVSAALRGGGIAGGLATGNIGLTIAAIATTPTIALPLLKAYGKIARIPASIIHTMARKMNLGKKFTAAERQIMLEAIRISSEVSP